MDSPESGKVTSGRNPDKRDFFNADVPIFRAGAGFALRASFVVLGLEYSPL
jgi:hypothetical protein